MSFITKSKVQEWLQTDRWTFTLNPQAHKDIYLPFTSSHPNHCKRNIHNILFSAKDFRQWDQTNLVLNSEEKVKPCFLFSLMCMCPESNGTKLRSHSFHRQNSGIFQTRVDRKGTLWKWILTIFNYKIEYHKHLDLQKVDEKNGVICLVSLFPPEYSP